MGNSYNIKGVNMVYLYRRPIPKGAAQDSRLVGRFWSKVSKKCKNGCWNWVPCPSRRYGMFKIGSTDYKVNRVSYTICKGNIPEGLSVLHTCDNNRCVNPKHLYTGDMLQNAK